MTQIAFTSIGVDFGATNLLSDVSFTVAPGERWGIVGRNGTGKTTLFRLLTGDLEPTRGSIARAPGLRVSLLEQHRDYGTATTVWEAAAGDLADLLALEQSLVEQAANLAHASSPRALARYGEDLERFERAGGYAVTARIDAVLHGLDFDPAQAPVTPLSALSGRQRGRPGRHRHALRGGLHRFCGPARRAPAGAAAGVRATATDHRAREGLHRAQHRGPEQQTGQGQAQTPRAAAAAQPGFRGRRHDGAAVRGGRTGRRSGGDGKERERGGRRAHAGGAVQRDAGANRRGGDHRAQWSGEIHAAPGAPGRAPDPGRRAPARR